MSLRTDSGFYDKKIFEYLETRLKSINYIIAAKFLQTIKISYCQREELFTFRLWNLDKRYDVSKSGLEKAKTIDNSKTRNTKAPESNG